MKKILVTGATGFIGSYLLPELNRTGWDITIALRQGLSASPEIAYKTVTVGNIDENTDWQLALKGVKYIVHLAARAHMLNEVIDNPEAEFLKVNALATRNLVKQAIAAGVKHFVFISSVGAITTLSEEKLTEKSVCHPDTAYGYSKLKAEEALIEIANPTTMTWTILRPTLVYGKGNPGNMERLMKLVKKGYPLPFASIQNHRSFIYVENLVEIIKIALVHPQAKNQIFLCSDGSEVSTPELIQLIAEFANCRCNLIAIPVFLLKGLGYLGSIAEKLLGNSLSLNLTSVDRLTGSLFVDVSKLKTQLNWSPSYSMQDGLAKTFRN